MSFAAEQLTQAKRYGTATLHEAAGRIGALPSTLKPLIPTMFLAGPARTVHVPAGDNLWIHRALYQSAPGDILVVATSGGVEFGYWGDILNEAALAVGLGGLVIDGGVRDTARLAEMPLPIFSNGVCIRGTIKGFDAIASTGQPIWVGDVCIRAGDLIVGDRDGGVALPAGDVQSILDHAAIREADEAAKIDQIRAGARTIDIYGLGDS
jgi:4-hydroxy-4-methyl-2-oxoglutarate aldolase